MSTVERTGGAATDPVAPATSVKFDLIVIGAGINGAGIARDAAARGLRVALVEREDIGSGTSNWSGRLVHGGLRYLEQGDVRLVRESLRERERLFRLAPHLVKPVPVMMPFYKTNRRSHWMVRVGMALYDVLSFDKSVSWHRTLSRRATLARSPGIDPDGLQGSAVFYDGQVVWSERLCVEVVVAAHDDGASIYTYAEVRGLLREGDRVTGIRYLDRLEGGMHELHGSLVVNAAGPWVDAVLAHDGRIKQRFIGGTKGSHLIVDPFPGAPTDVVYYESKADGRLVLIIPWGERYLIGTTDQRFEGDPETARADAGEVAYLLGEVNRVIPEAKLTFDDVLYTYSGVRPLPYVPDKSEWNVSRSHVIHDHAPAERGLLSIIGGKLTTYRSLAEETVDIVFKQLGRAVPRCPTGKLRFPGARAVDVAALRSELARTSLAPAAIDRLIATYGSRAGEVAALGEADPTLLQPIGNSTAAIGAELVFAFRAEFARTLTDALMRRTMLGHSPDTGRGLAERAAGIVGNALGWDAERHAREIADYHHYVERFETMHAVPHAPEATAAAA